MLERELLQLELEENERAREDAKRGLEIWRISRDPKLLLRTIYGFENQSIGSFLNTGSLEPVIFGARHPTIVTIFPFPREEDLKAAYGVSAARLVALVAEGHVIPL